MVRDHRPQLLGGQPVHHHVGDDLVLGHGISGRFRVRMGQVGPETLADVDASLPNPLLYVGIRDGLRGGCLLRRGLASGVVDGEVFNAQDVRLEPVAQGDLGVVDAVGLEEKDVSEGGDGAALPGDVHRVAREGQPSERLSHEALPTGEERFAKHVVAAPIDPLARLGEAHEPFGDSDDVLHGDHARTVDVVPRRYFRRDAAHRGRRGDLLAGACPTLGVHEGVRRRRAIVARFVQGAVDRVGRQDLDHPSNARRLAFGDAIESVIHRLDLRAWDGARVAVDGEVALLRHEAIVATEALRATDHLLDAVHVVPRLHDVHLAHAFEVEALGGDLRHQHHLDATPVRVGRVIQRADVRVDLRGEVLRAGHQRVLALRATPFVERGDQRAAGASISGVLERDRHGEQSVVEVLRVHQYDALRLLDVAEDRGDLRGGLCEVRPLEGRRTVRVGQRGAALLATDGEGGVEAGASEQRVSRAGAIHHVRNLLHARFGARGILQHGVVRAQLRAPHRCVHQGHLDGVDLGDAVDREGRVGRDRVVRAV